MRFSEGKGLRAGLWYANEIFKDSDINFLNEAEYTDFIISLATQTNIDDPESSSHLVSSGLRLVHNNLLTSDLNVGVAVSATGYYLNDGEWGFVASSGDLFAVVVPVSTSVAVLSGGANDRIDVVEVRPVRTPHDTQSRNFKDPVTGLVTSAPVDVKVEYDFEFAVRKGDDTSALANEQTTFTVNSATVGSDIEGNYILFSTGYGDYYVWYDTGSSTDPAVSGRTGIQVSIGGADDDDAIALATRTELDGMAGIVVTGTLGAIILTSTTYADLTDSTNGDMTTYFDTISIVDGNGATVETSGWIKLAEVYVASSASAIDQDDIKDWRDSSLWNHNISETIFKSSYDKKGTELVSGIERFTADSAITDRRAVFLGDDGNIESDVDNYTLSKGTINTYETVATVYDGKICRMSENVCILVSKQDADGIANVITESSSTVSVGADAAFETGGAVIQGTVVVDRLSATHFVVIWVVSSTRYARVGSYSGSTITFGSTVTLTISVTAYLGLARLNDSQFFVAGYSSTGPALRYQMCDVSGTAITVKTSRILTDSVAGGVNRSHSVNTMENGAVIHQRLVASSEDGLFSVSGLGVTGEDVLLIQAKQTFKVPSIDVDDLKYIADGIIAVVPTSSASGGGVWLFLYDVLGGSITPKGRAVVGTGPNYTFVKTACDGLSPYHIFIAGQVYDGDVTDQVAGYLLSFGSEGIANHSSKFVIDSPLSVTSSSMEVCALTRSKFVCHWVEQSSGEGHLCVVDTTNIYKAIGVSLEGIASGGRGLVQTMGIVDGFSSLTIGAKYYFGDDGTIGTDKTFGYLGTAISATEIRLEL